MVISTTFQSHSGDSVHFVRVLSCVVFGGDPWSQLNTGGLAHTCDPYNILCPCTTVTGLKRNKYEEGFLTTCYTLINSALLNIVFHAHDLKNIGNISDAQKANPNFLNMSLRKDMKLKK